MDGVTLSDGMLALLATILGGTGLKVVESWLHRNRDKIDVDLQYREELRKDLASIKAELQTSNSELDEWKDKYYESQRTLNEKLVELQLLLGQLKAFHKEADNDKGS